MEETEEDARPNTPTWLFQGFIEGQPWEVVNARFKDADEDDCLQGRVDHVVVALPLRGKGSEGVRALVFGGFIGNTRTITNESWLIVGEKEGNSQLKFRIDSDCSRHIP